MTATRNGTSQTIANDSSIDGPMPLVATDPPEDERRAAFGALRSPAFLRFWSTITLSLTGVWVRITAQGWLNYDLTEDEFLLGLVSFFQAAPVLLASPIAGAILDRVDRRRVLLVVQLVVATTMLALGTLTATGTVEVWHVMVLAVIAGTATALAPYFPDQLHAYFQFDVSSQLLSAATSGSGRGLVTIVEESIARLPEQRWAPFLTNHDQARAMTALNGDIDRAKLAATALLTLPGLPFVYYGEEIGMLGTKPDERLRTPMPWTGDPTGGFTTAEPWQPFAAGHDSANVAAELAAPDSLLNHYRRLIHLHASHPALGHGDFVPLETEPRSVTGFVRRAGDDAVLVLINFGLEPVPDPVLAVERGGLPAGVYQASAILGKLALDSITIAADGAITGDGPLPPLAPLTGYVFDLSPEAARS